jgi:hypothetical protein
MRDITAGLDSKDSFLVASPVEDRTIDGTKVTTWRMKMIPEKLGELNAGVSPISTEEMVKWLYGTDGMVYSAADLGNRVLITMGGSDDTLSRALKAAKTAAPTPFSKALAAGGADTVGYFRMDVRAIMREITSMMSRSESGLPKVDVPPGDPVYITATANAAPKQLRARVALDVAKMMNLFKAMKPK